VTLDLREIGQTVDELGNTTSYGRGPLEPDWSFTSNPEAMRVIERAARHMANKYDSTRTIEEEDAYQEGLILVATHPLLQACFTDPSVGLGALYYRLVQQLTTKVRSEANRRTKQTSYEANLEALGEAA
jgi:hypothetical protein